jgi:predicted ATP-dependent protease
VTRSSTNYSVGPHLDELREAYSDQPEVLTYLDQVQSDLPEHLDDFRSGESEAQQQAPLSSLPGMQREEHLARYSVNLFVDNDDLKGAPVIVERNPTYYNLIGRIDYRATFGAQVTDFRQIKPGALQRANGGFLVLNVLDVMSTPFAWEALKRSLICAEVTIENLGEQYTALPTVRLRPEPIPLDIKVILLGPPEVYYLLYRVDPNFQQLFKVKADFAPDMDWNDEHLNSYAAFISKRVREEGLRHFDREAMARIIEYGARLREDQRKLSSRLRDIADMIGEASYWAGKAGHDIVQAADVDQAIARWKYRSNLIEERIQEMIDNGTIMIDTTGARAAQVNGMAVIDLGGYPFGKPSRITARVSPGRGSVQSIEREIQAVGGVTPKIEGFFAVCKAKGLNGEQGIIIPAANVPNLMLDEEVIDAVQAGKFHIWAVHTVDEGIELLTGQPAGQRDPDGQYPEGTVHRMVEERLREYAERLRSFTADHKTEADRDHGATGPSIAP